MSGTFFRRLSKRSIIFFRLSSSLVFRYLSAVWLQSTKYFFDSLSLSSTFSIYNVKFLCFCVQLILWIFLILFRENGLFYEINFCCKVFCIGHLVFLYFDDLIKPWSFTVIMLCFLTTCPFHEVLFPFLSLVFVFLIFNYQLSVFLFLIFS